MISKGNIVKLNFERGTILLDAEPPDSLKLVSKTIPMKFDPRVPVWRCDPLHYADLMKELESACFQIEDNIPQWWDEVTWGEISIYPPRDEQQKAIDGWMKTKRGTIVMPTGTGKTEVALNIMKELAVSTLVVAPVRDLMYQWHRRIKSGLDYDAGIIGDNTYRVKHVSVITYDSACIHMDKLGNVFKLIVFDECHHLPGLMRREAALMSAAPFRMGLTATPNRADGLHKDLDTLIGPKVFELDLSTVRGNTLADYQVIRIPVKLSDREQERYDSCSAQVRNYMMKKRKDNDGNYDWQDLLADTAEDPEAREVQKAYYMKQSIEDRAEEKFRVLEDLFRLHIGERVIIFTGTNTMARDISRRFLVPCLLNHCRKNERLDILDGFKDGVYPAIVANQVLDEGVDIPAAKVAVVLGGQTSVKQAVQRLGRILRKSGHKDAVFYEVVCSDTSEEKRSRQRRSSDAYQGTRHRRI